MDAFGNTSAMASMSSKGTGAPAESTSSTPAHAARCCSSSSEAVAATFKYAAGEAKTMVARPAMIASAIAVAVSVFGFVTDMSGVTEVAPMAGPNKANGGKPATRPVPSVTLKVLVSTAASEEMSACV